VDGELWNQITQNNKSSHKGATKVEYEAVEGKIRFVALKRISQEEASHFKNKNL
jgi:hypothetical protein